MGNLRSDKEAPAAPMFCQSFADAATLESIEPIGDVAAAILRDNAGELTPKAKTALIEAVRAGKHVELRARAITFRQRDGSPNKNHLRFKSSKLGEIAASFVGKPFLVDHAKWSQSARKGTILESEAVPLAGGWVGFRQVLHVVKPDAVISVLDGTLDVFSIGWDPRGQVICTAHEVDVRSRKSCYWTEGCYPGKLVDIDGEKKIAEYEWQSTEGLETSGVNAPAVTGTKIENVKAALAAELGLLESPDPEPNERPATMPFPNLSKALALSTLTEADDEKASSVVSELRSELAGATSERDAAIKRAELAEGELKTLRAKVTELEGGRVDAVLEEKGYKAGKLIRGRDENGKPTPSAREVRLRRIAREDGLSQLEAELAEMPVAVPVGRAELEEGVDPNPRASSGPLPKTVLASTAKQLGIAPEELEQHANHLSGRARGDN
jgi:hypothetical protein